MKLTKGLSLSNFLEQIHFSDSVCAIAVNQKNEIVEVIAYDQTSTDPKESVFTSMIYNGWIEDGTRQNASKFLSPKDLWKAYKFYALRTEKEKKDFLEKVEFPPVNLNMLFIDLLPSYGFILNSLREGQPISKPEFIDLFKKTFDTTVHRNNLFLYAIQDSKFETIKKKQGAAIFNE